MINVKQTTAILGVSDKHVRKLITDKKLNAQKIGTRYMIAEADVNAFKLTMGDNQRTCTETPKSAWFQLGSQPAVSRLCDNKATRFWDVHCRALSDNLPLSYAQKPKVFRPYTKSTHLTHAGHVDPPEICVEPAMKYAISDTQVKIVNFKTPNALKEIWFLWMSETSRLYNFTTNHLEKNPADLRLSKRKLRDKLKPIFSRHATYPDTALQYAIYEARLAAKAGKPKKKITGTFSVDGRCILEGYIYKKNVRAFVAPDKTAKQLKDAVAKLAIPELAAIQTEAICKVVYDEFRDAFCVHVPIPIKRYEIVKKPFISLDPGIRSFMTYFDGSTFGEIGAGYAKSFEPLMKAIDRLQQKIAISNHKKRKSYQKAQNRIYRKITNKVNDLHCKTVNFLGGYENIFLPSFAVKKLAEGLDEKNSRRLMALAHFKFKQRLAFKTTAFNNRVIICNEAYTSKTCTRCGVENHNLGKKKIFDCVCGIRHDRDYNGARNIALRVLTQSLAAGRPRQ
jgi:excisionase family DNA binding protein